MLDDKIVVYSKNTNEALQTLREWMKTEATKYIKKKVKLYSKKFGINFRNIYVRDLNKWGYCNKLGNLTFNWKLISLPQELIEY